MRARVCMYVHNHVNIIIVCVFRVPTTATIMSKHNVRITNDGKKNGRVTNGMTCEIKHALLLC